jgi:hypothetical protein
MVDAIELVVVVVAGYITMQSFKLPICNSSDLPSLNCWLYFFSFLIQPYSQQSLLSSLQATSFSFSLFVAFSFVCALLWRGSNWKANYNYRK